MFCLKIFAHICKIKEGKVTNCKEIVPQIPIDYNTQMFRILPSVFTIYEPDLVLHFKMKRLRVMDQLQQ